MNSINYIKLFFSVFLAITLAILVSGTVFKYWLAYEAELIVEQASLEMNETRVRLERESEQRKIFSATETEKRRQQKIANQREQERQLAANKTNREVCVFWQKQYSKNKTTNDKRMRDTACNRARNYQ